MEAFIFYFILITTHTFNSSFIKYLLLQHVLMKYLYRNFCKYLRQQTCLQVCIVIVILRLQWRRLMHRKIFFCCFIQTFIALRARRRRRREVLCCNMAMILKITL